jgi:hypothetical protein
MGAPVLASRGVTGSGDVASPPAFKKKKRKASPEPAPSEEDEALGLSFPGMEKLRKFWDH